MNTAKQRVENEASELSDKIAALDTFINMNVSFNSLSYTSQRLLVAQLQIMRSYYAILTLRYDTWYV